MAYQLQLDADLGDDLKRIAAAQLERLENLLSDQREPGRGHHKTRRCLKKLRALAILLRPERHRRAWRRLDQDLARLGRALSPERDHAVVQEVLAKLAAEDGDWAIQSAISGLLRHLHVPDDTSGDGSIDRKRLCKKPARLGRRFNVVIPGRLTESRLFSAMTAQYRAGRKAIDAAYASRTAEAFHELRKHVQRHIRHLQLIYAIHPAEIQVRIESARRVAASLGEDHDLSLVQSAMRDASRAGARANGFGALDRLCRDRQRAVRKAIAPELRRLYAERPKAFRHRMRASWEAVADEGPLPL